MTDCHRLGRALLDLAALKTLRIHRSKLEYPHCQALAQHLAKNHTLVELDLSHCAIGDRGALCVAKILQIQRTLRTVNLTNNYIGQIGAEGLAFVMCQSDCVALDGLVLKTNPLGSEGTMVLLRALIRCDIPRMLSLSGCMLEEEIITKLSMMLMMNQTLKELDLSNNWFGERGGQVTLEVVTDF